MSLTFQMRRDRHAIGEFSASVHFFQPVSTDTLAEGVTELKTYAREHGLSAPVNTTGFAFNIATGVAMPTAGMSAGWQRFSDEGEPTTTVQCDPTSISFSSRNYNSWEEMLPIIDEFFCRIGQIYLQSVPAISKIQISYLNEFVSMSETANSRSELFKQDSAWLPKVTASFDDAWHSHVGAYIEVTELSRKLVNVNIECKHGTSFEDNKRVTLASALFIISENYDIPEKPPLLIREGVFKEVVRSKFDLIHALEKEIVSDVFATPYLLAMGIPV